MEVGLLVGALRRGAVLVLALTVLGVIVGVAVGDGGAAPPTAQATLLLDPEGGRGPGEPAFVGDPDRYVESQLSILRSRSLAAVAAEAVPGMTADDVADDVDVSQRAGSSVVDVVAEAATPERARQIADAVATAYVEQRTAGGRAQLATRTEELGAQLAAVRDRLDDVEARLAADETESPSDLVERETLLSEYDALLATRSQLEREAYVRDETSVIDAAVNITADGSSPITAGVVGGALGAAAGVAVAVALALAAPTVVDRRHAEQLLDEPVLAELRTARRASGDSSITPMSGRAGDDIRRVAAFIGGEDAVERPRVVAVGSPSGGADTTRVARALAAAFAADGFRVGYLPLDGAFDQLEGPATRKGRRTWRLATAEAGLSVVRPATPGVRLMDEDDVGELRREVAAEVDVLVLDVPPILRSSVGSRVARAADDLAVVVPLLEQREDELEVLRHLLDDGAARRVHVLCTRRRRVLEVVRGR